MRDTSSEAQRRKHAKRLKIVEAFRDNRPEWMMMEVVPVIPPSPAGPAGRWTLRDL